MSHLSGKKLWIYKGYNILAGGKPRAEKNLLLTVATNNVSSEV